MTETPTVTATPTVTNTLGPLGTRHFVLNQSKSLLEVKVEGGLTIPLGHFLGQTDGKPAPAFLDLQAGQPDEHGFVPVNVVAASDFIYVDATMLAHFVLCIKPLVPVPAAGLLGCYGGTDISISLDENHHVGEVGVDGFTADQCTMQTGPIGNGHIEVPYAACSAGMVGQICTADADCDTSTGSADGVCAHFPARCNSVGGNVGPVCTMNSDCGTSGQCGMPHPGVCNGPLLPSVGTGDTGPGELFIVPNPAQHLNGLPIELGFESALPCGDEGPGIHIGFALTTGASKSQILNANNQLGQTLSFEADGENFECENWQNSTRGRLVLSAPALDQMLVGDVATIFVFSSH